MGSVLELSLRAVEGSCSRKECRICLEEMREAVRSYCSCRGDLAAVHESCLLEWLRKDKSSSPLSDCSRCEICRDSIELVVERRCGVHPLPDLCRQLLCGESNWEQRNEVIGLLSTCIICVVVLVVLVVAYLSKMRDMLVVCIIVVLACIALMSAVYFFLKFVLKVERRLVGVVEKRGRCRSKQVLPE